MLVWIVCLTESLLPGRIILTRYHPSRGQALSGSSHARSSELSVLASHRAAVVNPLLFLLGTLLEEDFAQDVFLFLM